MKFVNKNYYEILDVEPDASEEEIRRAYQLVRGTWNPDSIAVYSLYTPEENDAIGHKIEEAFHILSNAERRASYDRFMREVDRIPPHIATPSEFWDFAHGIAPPEEEDGIEDVTDLLSESEVASGEMEGDVLLEAAGGEGRAFSQVASPEAAGGEVRPDRAGLEVRHDPGPDPAEFERADSGITPDHRQRSRTHELTPERLHSAGLSLEPASGGRDPRPGQGVAERSRQVRERRVELPPAHAPRAGRVPPAPAAPPDAGADPGARSAGQKAARVDDRGRAATPGHRPSGAKGVHGAETTTVARRWTKSYSRPLRVPSPLPDRPIPEEMMARLLAEHGYSGALLEAVREFKQIRLEEISDRTKIQKTYLRFLEEERFDTLPARVYVEGFVSQYARLLRLDAKRVSEGYMARYDRKMSPTPPPEDTRSDDS